MHPVGAGANGPSIWSGNTNHSTTSSARPAKTITWNCAWTQICLVPTLKSRTFTTGTKSRRKKWASIVTWLGRQYHTAIAWQSATVTDWWVLASFFFCFCAGRSLRGAKGWSKDFYCPAILSFILIWCCTGRFLTTILNAILSHKNHRYGVTWRLQTIFKRDICCHNASRAHNITFIWDNTWTTRG